MEATGTDLRQIKQHALRSLNGTIQPLVRCAVSGEGDALEKAAQYRTYAAECRALARRAVDQYARISFLKMAEVWDDLANKREEVATRPKNRKTGQNRSALG